MKHLQTIIIVAFFLSIHVQAKTIFVKENARGAQNGETWKNAYVDLQKAIACAQDNDQIWVAEGTYFPTTTNDKTASFTLKENVTLYGGFEGSETELNQRNWEKNQTILSGNIGDTSSYTDNSIHVVITANNAILDGFIVQDGYAMGGMGGNSQDRKPGQGNGGQRGGRTGSSMGQPQTHTTPQNILQSSNTNAGGGILNFKTSASIRNCIIRNCYAGKGGGVYNMTNTSERPGADVPSPVFINVKIQNNFAVGRGGGMQNDMSTSPVLIQCEFTNNVCEAKGGALYNDFGCSPILISCLFENNKAHDAAAIGNDGSSSPIIIDSKIVNNVVESQGAGLYQGSYNANMKNGGNMPLVINSVIKNNTSRTNGISNVTNWGEDWIYAWKSEIEDFNHSMNKPDAKYDGLLQIARQIKSLDAQHIDEMYAQKLIGYININIPEKTKGNKPQGFGTNNELSKTANIPQNVIYVKKGDKNGDGKTWESAFSSLQDALNSAEKAGGAEIWMAAGTYKPATDKNRSETFRLRNGVAIYGGFSGSEKNKSERDPLTNLTILSGNIGDEKSANDNSYHVLTGAINSILDGVTIADGYADGKITDRFGGGLFCWGYESSSIIKNCTFTNNYAEDGGAVFCFADVLSYFENVHFNNNKAIVGGAASFRFGASCELNNCTFSQNSANARAGAMLINYGSNVIIDNTTFRQNSTQGNGGAIWVDDQASQYGETKPVISNCTFLENTATFYGGAIHNYNIATTQITNCDFNQNKAQFGNDIANTLRCQVSITNKEGSNPHIYNDESSVLFNPNNQNFKSESTQIKTLEDVDFSVTVIGSGSPQYNPERSQPSALVQYKGTTILVDMGNGTKTQLEKLGLSGRKAPDALFITHHHIDHNDEFISMVHSKLMTNKDFLIVGPAPIDEMTAYVKKFYSEDLNYRRSSTGKTFDATQTHETIKVVNGGESFEYKGLEISTLEVPHSIKTIAYRFDADGKSIVITGDLSYTDELHKFAQNADILLIDGKTFNAQTASRSGNGSRQNNISQNNDDESLNAHASIQDIAKMASASAAKTMVVTHLGNQAIDAEATSTGYANLGFKGKVLIAADFLTITPDGESFMLSALGTSNNAHKRTTQNTGRTELQLNPSKGSVPISGQQNDPMKRLDTNGDNKISLAEAKGPLKENFSRTDANGDGFVTADELQNRRSR